MLTAADAGDARAAWTVRGGASDEELAALTAVLALLLQAPQPRSGPVSLPVPTRIWAGPWVTRWLGRHRTAA